MWNYDGDWLRWIECREIGGVYHVWGGGGVACTKFPTANSGKNDIEKTIIQKRNENENENTVKNEK